MQTESTTNGIYSFDGVLYQVIETPEIHKLISEDAAFAANYINQNKSCLEIIGVDREDEVVANNNTAIFFWDARAIKLLIFHYNERKLAFRDPKIKKRTLWGRIQKEFVTKGYESVSIDILDTKFRNMKKTFKTTFDNNKKKTTGRGRVSWSYYAEFLKLFEDDFTKNFGHTVSSCASPSNNTSGFSSPSVASNSPSDRLPISNSVSTPLFVSTVKENLLKVISNPTSPSLANESESPASTPTKHLKAERGEKLCQFRKQQIDIEEQRIQQLKELKEAVERSNKIQERRNELLEMFVQNRNNL
ncbi:hypothetical protein FQA39_LY17132 [Lamprigera yunnana]|nr:hypothetical protein FQA39_LY17132 [Lamprigera yunnana]